MHFYMHELASRVSHLNPELMDSAAMASQLAPGIPVPASQSLGLQTATTATRFKVTEK